jgi:hypothetical protein
MASTAAELWNEVLQRLDEVQSVAPSSAELWNEVLQRLDEVREAHTKLVTAVDHLGALLSTTLVTERQRNLARRGIATDPALDTDVPPLLLPASADVEVRESRESGDEAPLLPEQTVADALATPEERETHEPEAREASSEDEHPWLTESVVIPAVDDHETEEEGPWLAELGVTAGPTQSAEAPTETAEAPPETAVLEASESVAPQDPQVVDALLTAEFGDAAVRVVDPETLTLDAFLAEEFAPADRGNGAPPENLLPPTPTDDPPWSIDFPFLAGESTLPVEPPPIPEPLAPADTGDIEGTLTDDTAAPEADLDPPLLSFDSPFLAGESTLPVEPPPIPEPLAPADTGDIEGTLTDVGDTDETAAPEANSDRPPPSFASMTTEILEAAPAEPLRVADGPPAEKDTLVSQGQLGPNMVSEDFTITSKRHKHLRLRPR